MSFEERLSRFLKLYQDMEKKSAQDDVFNKEFTFLKSRSLQWKNEGLYPADAGSIPINRKKNRFKDILPFEYTRVQLHLIEGIEYSDYVNANYINGPSDIVEYVAAQGPLPHTISDFWRMLWYHNIEIVVMACREVEMGKPKCEKYWTDPGDTREFGPISVTCTKEEKMTDDVTIRDIRASCGGEVQLIRQYHYQTWPDHDKPSSPEPLMQMLDMIRSYQQRKETPIVVHCSAGCGRTGTVIATDYIRGMINNKSLSSDLSIFNIVETMRKQRPAMVQTKIQYHFLYIAAATMAQMALTADVVPEKPVAPKPVFNEMPPATASKSDYMNMAMVLPDYENNIKAETKAVTHSDYTNLSADDPPGQVYENRESILTSGLDDVPKPGDNLSNPASRRPKAIPRVSSPVHPPRTDTAPPRQPPNKPPRPTTFPIDNAEAEDVLDSSINSNPSLNTSKGISDILMGVFDELDEPDQPEKSESFGGFGELITSPDESIPKLPCRTEESKQLLDEFKDEESNVYSEPAPVWSSPSKPPKIDDNVSNSPPSQRKALSSPATSSGSIGGPKPSTKTHLLGGLFRSKGGQASARKKITAAEISSPVGALTKGPPPEGLLSSSNRSPATVPIPLSSRTPAVVPISGPAVPVSSNTLPRVTPVTGSANSKYNFPGEEGFGIRLAKPKGPRKEPESWSRWNFA